MIFKIKKRIAPTETKKPAFLSLSHMITQLLLLACFDQRQIAYLLTVFNLILATYENAVTYKYSSFESKLQFVMPPPKFIVPSNFPLGEIINIPFGPVEKIFPDE